MVACLHFRRYAGGLQLMEYHPSAYLIQQHGLHPTVQGVYPRLVVLRGLPNRDNIVAVLIEAHLCADRIRRAAAKAVIAAHARPRVMYQSHKRIKEKEML